MNLNESEDVMLSLYCECFFFFFCVMNGTFTPAKRSCSNPVKVFYMKLFVLMQPPS